MRIVNLTPHPITIHTAGAEFTIQPEPAPARLKETRLPSTPLAYETLGGDPSGHADLTPQSTAIPVDRVHLGHITGLPDPVDGTVFVVSRDVARAARRADVFSPGLLVRDEQGYPVGCQGLTSWASKPIPTGLDAVIRAAADVGALEEAAADPHSSHPEGAIAALPEARAALERAKADAARFIVERFVLIDGHLGARDVRELAFVGTQAECAVWVRERTGGEADWEYGRSPAELIGSTDEVRYGIRPLPMGPA